MSGTRIERDSLGEIEVPAEAYYGAQTERARRNFPLSDLRVPASLIAALGRIKAEAARVNRDLGVLPDELAAAVVQAAEEVAEGRHDDQFPVDLFQTGSGTSTHMNVNEVIAGRANELLGGERGGRSPVHPNDHVNAGQSSNDVFPSAIHLAAYGAVRDRLEPGLTRLQLELETKSKQLDDVVKIGRTHLQDAVPVRMGQELAGHAQQVANGRARIEGALPRLAELALGGTAVGTGLNAPEGFADAVIERLASHTGHPFVGAPSRFEALASRDALVELSATLRTVAVSLTKVSNDLRWLSSGPRCGLGEIRLPALQPGSSIMPGKVNPVLPEALLMICAQVVGNDTTIAWSGAAGNFELNVMMPVMAHALLQSIELLGNGSEVLAERCVRGIEPNRERAAEMVERSLALATALAPEIGYDAAAEIAKEAHRSGATVREVALEKGIDEELVKRLLDARRMSEGK